MSKTEQDEEMVLKIVQAFASRPDAAPDQIVELFSKLRRELGSAETEGTPAAVEAPSDTAEPIMPIEQAVTQDRVFCLCCGRGFKMLKRHLGAEHGLTEQEYRLRFGLPEDMPLVAPSYSRQKASYAKDAGFGKYDRHATQKAKTTDAEKLA
ncbi:MucR family transcriptional regulator [Histidinibacterium aquaticum]|uniref:MucR family transcriptional regulator n=1 Tax=Histidinibacterium aquaticum TaxID=2613962 RepID=A0A5J5GNQ3_9RHOB|nr:MucR family transcriptional regulator [Histidinibacterium aquaticum]KAA9009981.1 MucR family transcriptional regulator [Histidinibacterium aquaticum]